MTRKLTRFFAVAALFGRSHHLNRCTRRAERVLAAASLPTNDGRLWQKDEDDGAAEPERWQMLEPNEGRVRSHDAELEQGQPVHVQARYS
jgi:hypothetical protein